MLPAAAGTLVTSCTFAEIATAEMEASKLEAVRQCISITGMDPWRITPTGNWRKPLVASMLRGTLTDAQRMARPFEKPAK